MSKQALQKIIDNVNFWAKHSDKPVMNIDDLSEDNANALFETIDSGLSPENLHCDGEITRAQATKKFNTYMQAVKELRKRGFAIPNDCYEIG